MLHTISSRQFLAAGLSDVWAFMSSPQNLAKITPQYMGFEILTPNEELGKMYPGQIIEYHVRPLMGIKLHWVTEITHVKDLEFFVDEQRMGPYAFWHHKHFIKEVEGGVEMYDLVHYELPLGVLGKLANDIFVKRQLHQVFDFRYKALEKHFNAKK